MAIAFDAKSGADDDTGANSTLTVSHTCTGGNKVLVVYVLTNNSAFASGVTYNGVAMTLIANLVVDGTVRISLFYLLAPATGANNVVATATGNTLIRVRCASYTGVKQTGQPDASATQGATVSPDTTTLTTVANNCWTMLAVRGSSVTITASTGSTERTSGTALDMKFFDSNAALSAGSNSMAVTLAGGSGYTIMASFVPAPASAEGGAFFLFM